MTPHSAWEARGEASAGRLVVDGVDTIRGRLARWQAERGGVSGHTLNGLVRHRGRLRPGVQSGLQSQHPRHPATVPTIRAFYLVVLVVVE
jgi:hypothetical protein